jgi:hypothetical protein
MGDFNRVPDARRIFAVVAIALLGMLCARTSVAAASGEILALSGAASIETDGQQRPVAMGDPIQVGDIIDVPQDSKVRLRMNDGSIITLAPGTRMTIDKYDVDGSGVRQDVELTMSSGLLRTVVSAGSGTPNFEVKTATGVAAVRGTDWYIDAQGDATRVYVVAGIVSLSDPSGGSSVTISPMEASTVDAHKEPMKSRPVTQLELSALVKRTGFGLGLCQCVSTKTNVTTNCRPTTNACQAFCAGGGYSFVPNAPDSCGQP